MNIIKLTEDLIKTVQQTQQEQEEQEEVKGFWFCSDCGKPTDYWTTCYECEAEGERQQMEAQQDESL
jgi:hypothetical protein